MLALSVSACSSSSDSDPDASTEQADPTTPETPTALEPGNSDQNDVAIGSENPSENSDDAVSMDDNALPIAPVTPVVATPGNPDIDVDPSEFNDIDVANYPATINTNLVNIRSYPSTLSGLTIIGQKNTGDEVVVTQINGQWDKIFWPNGQDAYVLGTFTTQTIYSSAPSIKDNVQIVGFGGKCIEAPEPVNGTTLIMKTCTGEKNQEWTLKSTGEIISAVDGTMCLDLAGPSSNNGTAIQVWKCNDNRLGNQAWEFETTRPGRIRLQTLLFENKCVDVTDRSTAEGAKLQLYTCNDSDNKIFIPETKYGLNADIDKYNSGAAAVGGSAVCSNANNDADICPPVRECPEITITSISDSYPDDLMYPNIWTSGPSVVRPKGARVVDLSCDVVGIAPGGTVYLMDDFILESGHLFYENDNIAGWIHIDDLVLPNYLAGQSFTARAWGVCGSAGFSNILGFDLSSCFFIHQDGSAALVSTGEGSAGVQIGASGAGIFAISNAQKLNDLDDIGWCVNANVSVGPGLYFANCVSGRWASGPITLFGGGTFGGEGSVAAGVTYSLVRSINITAQDRINFCEKWESLTGDSSIRPCSF